MPPRGRLLFCWLLPLLTALDLCLVVFDQPRLARLGRLLGQDPGKPSADWWVWLAGLRGWSPPEGFFAWEASWSWTFIAHRAPLPIWIAFFAIGVVALTEVLAIDRWDRTRRSSLKMMLGLGTLIVTGWALENVALALRGGNPFQTAADLVQNPGFGGYLACAEHLPRWDELFSSYVRVVGYHPEAGHCAIHPPGGVMMFSLLMHLLGALPAKAVLGLVSLVEARLHVAPTFTGQPIYLVDFLTATLGAQCMLFWTATLPVPCFFLARRLAGRDLALRLAAFGLLIPGVLLMSPTLDQALAPISAWILVFLFEGLESSPILFGVVAGLSSAAGFFFSYAFWILIFPFAAILIMRVATAHDREGRPALRRVALIAGAAAVSAAVAWLAIWLLAGFDFPSSLQFTAQTLATFNHKRPYRVWVILNIVDFVQHVGLPLACATLLGLVSRPAEDAGSRPTTGGTRQSGWHLDLSARGYSWLFWTFLLALDLTGWNRGEVARLWIFLMPLGLLALYQCVGAGRLRGAELASLAGAQFLVCGVMAGFWKNFSP
jgi:hypothetical protein